MHEFEGDIMMTADQWKELKKEFQRTGQPVPYQLGLLDKNYRSDQL